MTRNREIYVYYTTHKEKRRIRHLRPLGIRWGSTEWRPTEGLLIRCVDLETGEEGEFSDAFDGNPGFPGVVGLAVRAEQERDSGAFWKRAMHDFAPSLPPVDPRGPQAQFQAAYARFLELWDRLDAGGSVDVELREACDELDVQRAEFLGHGAGSMAVKAEIDRAREKIEPIDGDQYA